MGKRIFIWILLIVFVFVGNFIFQLWSSPSANINIQYDTFESPELSALRSYNIKVFGTDTEYNVKNANVIFSLSNEDIQGFKKYEDYLISPMIMFAGNHALYDDSGFSVSNLSSDFMYRRGSKDLQSILLAMEQGKKWEDLGIKETCLSGPITLHIPDKNSPYHPLVKELFLINLGENITEENIDSLLERVNNLINKCVLVEDVKNFMANNTRKDEMEKVMVIAPEYVLKNNSGAFSGNGNDKKITYMMPIYPTKTVALNYTLYIKEDVETDFVNKILDKYNSKEIVKKTGLRTMYHNVSLTDHLNSHVITDINVHSLPMSIKEKIQGHKTTLVEKTVVGENAENIVENQETEESEEKVEKSKTFGDYFLIVMMIILGIFFVLFLIALAVETF